MTRTTRATGTTGTSVVGSDGDRLGLKVDSYQGGCVGQVSGSVRHSKARTGEAVARNTTSARRASRRCRWSVPDPGGLGRLDDVDFAPLELGCVLQVQQRQWAGQEGAD